MAFRHLQLQKRYIVVKTIVFKLINWQSLAFAVLVQSLDVYKSAREREGERQLESVFHLQLLYTYIFFLSIIFYSFSLYKYNMATRSRTLLFLQYRNSYARTQGSAPHFSAGLSETEGLIESSDNVIEMSVLPPKWLVYHLSPPSLSFSLSLNICKLELGLILLMKLMKHWM
jgi:hypothetical protein